MTSPGLASNSAPSAITMCRVPATWYWKCGASLLLEVSPAAMAQGANRLDRGLRYDQHVRGLARAAGLPFRHRLVRLAGVGHTAADVLAAPQTREIVFG